MINNSFKLIGTIIAPFKKVTRGQVIVYETQIETQSTKGVHIIPLTFYPNAQIQNVKYKNDYTGKQVIVDGYIQGNMFQDKAKKKVIYYVYIVVTGFLQIGKGINNTKPVSNKGVEVLEDEFPI